MVIQLDVVNNHLKSSASNLLALYGPSGVGKSMVIHRIASRLRAEEPNPSFTPVVIVQASPEDVGSSARLDFYR